ncbi:MBL fold metallo-hydrolase [Imperialibacter roseus]|uniref:MBL fold metallo-hydrolase n=1 Tax=Imperialibacter roseus TaxID=1324217 RepID=A0ABZ0IMK1_9BACT|nr:MBL fold metallo-hydrolase [Imperialibacter roseus]WOK04986.1 MBL fold metallo-hydrolase [Imperialibacter roseus]
MKLTFLGTGTSQGVPVIACDCEVCQSVDFHDKRLRSSVHIEVDGLSLVIDTGPDFRQQMLRERIKRLDAVIFTHEHKDHTAGLDDIRSFNFLQQMDMPVYASTAVITQLKREFSYIFADHKYPGVPLVDVKLLDGKPFTIGNTTITPINVMHFKLPVFGFRIGDFTYITDANYISDEEKKKIKGSKVLVLNALQKTPHISHFTLDEAISLAQELKADQTYFTHISHKLGSHRDVSAQLPENIYLAYDGQQLTL